MRLVELSCAGFRCLKDLRFTPDSGVNIIRGLNAQGKTSLLEALLYAATSKSHRTNSEQELVQHEAPGFRIHAAVDRPDRHVVIDAVWWEGAKRFKVNGVPQTRLSDILGKIHLVFFSPEDVALVRGTAAQRRTFLDMELSQLSPPYLHALQQYRVILRQRNELLRSGNADPAQLDAWDAQLVTHGERLMNERAAFIAELSGHAVDAYHAIAGKETLSVAYRPDVRDGAPLAKALESARKSDLKQGVTTRGPHRDDLEIVVAGKPARQFGSQGQQRTAALALKLAELAYVRARIGEAPILLLDDVLSELDGERSRALLDSIPGDTQCLMTTTDLTDRADTFGDNCVRFTIVAGELKES